MKYKTPDKSYHITIANGLTTKIILISMVGYKDQKISLPQAKKMVRNELKEEGLVGWKIRSAAKASLQPFGNLLAYDIREERIYADITFLPLE